MINGVKFPNSTLSPNWYKGRQKIDQLHFNQCDLKQIDPNALDIEALHDIEGFQIEQNQTFELKNGMFTGFRKIEQIRFFTSLAHGGNVNCLKEVSKILIRLVVDLFPNEMTLSDIFGTSRMSNLRSLIVSSSANNVDLASRPLSPANFSRLPVIQHLTIKCIVISSIQPETFDFIGETLISLNLLDNKLKLIDVRLFFAIINRAQIVHKTVFFTGNRMICNCDFYETRTVIHQVFNFFFRDLRIFIPDCIHILKDDVSNLPHLKCEHLQQVKFHIKPDFLEKHHFRKVDISISNDIMIVSTKAKYRFRLLILIQRPPILKKNSKCPTKKWIRESAKCALLTGESNELPVAQFLRSTFSTTFCALLPTSPKRPWLLHCQTIRNKLEEYRSLIIVWIIWSGICFVSGFFGVFVVGQTKGYVKSMRASELTSSEPVTLTGFE